VNPKVLLVVDGYRYGGREIDRRDEVEAISAALPSVEHVVHVPYLRPSDEWAELVAIHRDLVFERVDPAHPLYVLYSSGTTGLPKAIVHGHGGILLEHLKVLTLHADLGPSSRFSWFTTTGWMMWNYLVSGLLVGATIVLYDGDPGHPTLDTLWGLCEAERLTWFGASAPFLMACRKLGLTPGHDHDLTTLRAVGSTGAPLPADGFRWVYDAVKPDVLLSSISGGTDVCSAFVGGCPVVPVRAGEISCRYLGVAVDSIDGELVITEPMPSMPVAFWGDADGSRYRAAYFEAHPGVWTHGDWVEFTEHGGVVITGRSDATLNRGGVRIGTAEIYGVVESIDGVADSLVVHLEDGDRLVLFVVADHDPTNAVRAALRRALSPRHVPDEVHLVPAIPTTLSGKKLEIPIKRILAGADAEEVASRDALRDPAALDAFVEIAQHGRAVTPPDRTT
jgi:acetoacetyl-CoA synthetase